MKSRILVSVVGVPVLLYIVLLAPPVGILTGLALLTGIGAFEFMRCIGCLSHKVLLAFTVAASMALLFFTGSPHYVELLFGFLIAAFFLAVFSEGKIEAHYVMFAGTAVILLPYAFSAFFRIHAAGFQRAYLLLPFILSFLSDTGGYFGGRLFGKHKLAPHISPKKTIEGAVGGLVGSIVGGMVFALIMNTWAGAAISYPGMAAVSLVCSVLAQVGDLSFSLVKREYGVKDYGKIFLEHGGVLDRFDSVIFVAPALVLLLPLIA